MCEDGWSFLRQLSRSMQRQAELLPAKRFLDLLLIAGGYSQTLLARADEVIQ
jgi:hypothetical protein